MNLKRMLAVLTLALAFPLSAQTLDPSLYSGIKKLLIVTGHQSETDLKAQVDKLILDPVPYLIALSKDGSLRIYAKQKALMLLQYYPTAASESYLKEKIADSSAHKSLRTTAVRSYARGFYWRNRSGVQAFLRGYQFDRVIGKSVDSSLKSVTPGNQDRSREPRVDPDIKRNRSIPDKLNPSR